MKLKALSLWQPWASLIAVGAKTYETRSWKTDYRGPLLICASKKIITLLLIGSWEFRQAARQALQVPNGQSFPQGLHGHAVAIVELMDCLPTFGYGWTKGLSLEDIKREQLFGDFSMNRYAWKLENVRALEPFPVKGRHGLFEVEVSADQLR